MRTLILTVQAGLNGVWWFDLGLSHGVQALNWETLLRSQISPGETKWFKPRLLIFRMHKSLADNTQWACIETAKAQGAKIGAWLSPFLPSKYRLTEEQKELHSEETMERVKEYVDFGLTWWGKDVISEYFGPWTTKFGIPMFQCDPAADSAVYGRGDGPVATVDLAYIGGSTWEKSRAREWLAPVLRRHSYIVCGKHWEDERVSVTDIKAGMDRKIYGQAKVCPNVHHDMVSKIPGMAPNQRLFQLAACGALQVTDAHPRRSEWFDDDMIIESGDKEDWQKQVEHYIHRPAKAASIRDRAYHHVMANHTFINRARDLKAFLGKL